VISAPSKVVDDVSPPFDMGLTSVALGCVHLCWEMLSFGVLLRGAVCRGRHFHEGSIAFSDTLIEAINLERAAAYLRIITDVPDAQPQMMWATDQDGVQFVNYMGLGLGSFYAKRHLSVDDAVHRAYESNAKHLKLDVRMKWAWFRRYYNEHAERLKLKPL
jgi:hypothetical protein